MCHPIGWVGKSEFNLRMCRTLCLYCPSIQEIYQNTFKTNIWNSPIIRSSEVNWKLTIYCESYVVVILLQMDMSPNVAFITRSKNVSWQPSEIFFADRITLRLLLITGWFHSISPADISFGHKSSNLLSIRWLAQVVMQVKQWEAWMTESAILKFFMRESAFGGPWISDK